MEQPSEIKIVEDTDELELSPEQIAEQIDTMVPIAIEAVKDCKIGDYGGNIKDRFQAEMSFSIVRFTWGNILYNRWAHGACWGQSRTGKSSAVLQLMFCVYHDWDAVLKATCFGLDNVLYKMNNKIPYGIVERIDKIYDRVPILMADDSGSINNKSITQSDESFNFLKGGLDLWGTRLSNLWHTMNQPSELTAQINQKYTCEMYIETRGIAKFDTCKWRPNYHGWVPNQTKKWKHTFPYEKVPSDVYQQYAGMRDEWIDYINQQYNDRQAETLINKLIERSEPIDYEYLEIFKKFSPLSSYQVETTYKMDMEVVKRLKHRNLLNTTANLTKHYDYDISNLGLELLKAKTITDDPTEYKKDLRKND